MLDTRWCWSLGRWYCLSLFGLCTADQGQAVYLFWFWFIIFIRAQSIQSSYQYIWSITRTQNILKIGLVKYFYIIVWEILNFLTYVVQHISIKYNFCCSPLNGEYYDNIFVYFENMKMKKWYKETHLLGEEVARWKKPLDVLDFKRINWLMLQLFNLLWNKQGLTWSWGYFEMSTNGHWQFKVLTLGAILKVCFNSTLLHEVKE